MTDAMPESAARAFAEHDSYERGGGEFVLSTTQFDGRVTARRTNGDVIYTLMVRAPSLQAATVEEVGSAVRQGWFETLERRLEDAPKATRTNVDLVEHSVSIDEERVTVTYTFTAANPSRAADIAKTFGEYVEGTYVQGVIPGYEYVSPVADLLESATQGDGSRGGTPL